MPESKQARIGELNGHNLRGRGLDSAMKKAALSPALVQVLDNTELLASILGLLSLPQLAHSAQTCKAVSFLMQSRSHL